MRQPAHNLPKQAKNIQGDENGLKTMKADLSTGSIGRWMVKLAVPSIVAQMINALYNIVDRIYIGHMGDDSSLALTGVGLCFPILMVISAFQRLWGWAEDRGLPLPWDRKIWKAPKKF